MTLTSGLCKLAQVFIQRLKCFSCAENVPVPDQLRTPAGIKQVKTVLRDKFAKSRGLQLHCIKLACRWPDHRSPYADLLGWLTTLGDVEALGYQWQGQKDKSHNADRLLKQVSKLHLMHHCNPACNSTRKHNRLSMHLNENCMQEIGPAWFQTSIYLSAGC